MDNATAENIRKQYRAIVRWSQERERELLKEHRVELKARFDALEEVCKAWGGHVPEANYTVWYGGPPLCEVCFAEISPEEYSEHKKVGP